MAEQNKSQLISEAELIEAINADSIISVSLGAGQPQKNVKLSTLASVVAGLFPFVKFATTTSYNDANKILSPIVYLNMDILSNVPSEFRYGTLICFGGWDHAIQFYIPASGNNVLFFRQYSSGEWKNWTRIV